MFATKTFPQKLVAPLLVIALICASLFTFERRDRHRLMLSLVEANDYWEAGEKSSAIPVYEDIIRNSHYYKTPNIQYLGREKGPMLYGRVIDWYATRGLDRTVRELILLSEEHGICPSCETEQGRIALRQVGLLGN